MSCGAVLKSMICCPFFVFHQNLHYVCGSGKFRSWAVKQSTEQHNAQAVPQGQPLVNPIKQEFSL